MDNKDNKNLNVVSKFFFKMEKLLALHRISPRKRKKNLKI